MQELRESQLKQLEEKNFGIMFVCGIFILAVVCTIYKCCFPNKGQSKKEKFIKVLNS